MVSGCVMRGVVVVCCGVLCSGRKYCCKVWCVVWCVVRCGVVRGVVVVVL